MNRLGWCQAALVALLGFQQGFFIAPAFAATEIETGEGGVGGVPDLGSAERSADALGGNAAVNDVNPVLFMQAVQASLTLSIAAPVQLAPARGLWADKSFSKTTAPQVPVTRRLSLPLVSFSRRILREEAPASQIKVHAEPARQLEQLVQSFETQGAPGDVEQSRVFDGALQGAPRIYVMDSLTLPQTPEEWDALKRDLAVMRSFDVHGVATDFSWRDFQTTRGQFHWGVLKRYVETVAEAGLKLAPNIAFHQIGGNVGDNGVYVPLPDFVWSLSANPQEDMMWRYEDGSKSGHGRGLSNPEYVFPGFMPIRELYQEALHAFGQEFAGYRGIFSQIDVSNGPSGELRVPSYHQGLTDYQYPGIGYLPFHSEGAKRSFRDYLRRNFDGSIVKLNQVFGSHYPSFDDIQPPPNTEAFFRTQRNTSLGRNSPYGHWFLNWVQSLLESHLTFKMTTAHEALDHFGVPLGAKISGVHWRYADPQAPYAAEEAAGYLDYPRLIERFRDLRTELIFTCLEMGDPASGTNPLDAFSMPGTLAKKIISLSHRYGVPVVGENALAISNSEPIGSETWGPAMAANDRAYRNIRGYLPDLVGFMLLRRNTILSNGLVTDQFPAFIGRIVRYAEDLGRERARAAMEADRRASQRRSEQP